MKQQTQVDFYGTPLCPRCRAAEKILDAMVKEFPETDFNKIDSVKDLQKSWAKGIRMIPAIQIGEHKISGIVLREKKIQTFLRKHLGT